MMKSKEKKMKQQKRFNTLFSDALERKQSFENELGRTFNRITRNITKDNNRQVFVWKSKIYDTYHITFKNCEWKNNEETKKVCDMLSDLYDYCKITFGIEVYGGFLNAREFNNLKKKLQHEDVK